MDSNFSEPKAARDKQREITTSKNSYRTAQSKTSVRKNDNSKDVDLGKSAILFTYICTYLY